MKSYLDVPYNHWRVKRVRVNKIDVSERNVPDFLAFHLQLLSSCSCLTNLIKFLCFNLTIDCYCIWILILHICTVFLWNTDLWRKQNRSLFGWKKWCGHSCQRRCLDDHFSKELRLAWNFCCSCTIGSHLDNPDSYQKSSIQHRTPLDTLFNTAK